MNEKFFFMIVVITSASRIDVLFNTVTVDQYKKYETGTTKKMSFENSIAGFTELDKATKDFKQNNWLDEFFVNAAGKDSGWFGAQGIAKLTLDDVKAHAAKIKKEVSDDVYVSFCHEKMIKNVGR